MRPPRSARGWADLAGWIAAAVIALAAWAAYRNSFAGPFVLDDEQAILSNATIHHFSARTILAPPRDATVGGRPVLNLSLAANYAWSGTKVGSYHELNLLIQIAAGLVLFGILRRTLARLGRAPADADGVAFAAALLWTIHPLQTEAVTYVVQRAESLMGLFYLLTLYCFVRGARLCPPDAGSAAAVEPNLWFGLSWLACLLGMATKEVMVTAPAMVFLYDRTFVAGSFREAFSRRGAYYAGLAATWILLGILFFSLGGNRNGAAGFNVGVEPWDYWLTQFPALATYLKLSFWPHPLVFEYGLFWVDRAGEVLPCAAVVLSLAGATIWALVRRPALGFLGAWFFGILALTSFIPGTTQMIVEHRMYLSLAAPMVLAALGLARLAALLPPRWRQGTLLVLALAAGGGFAALTAARNRDYRSALVLWQDTLRKRPDNALAECSLGLVYFKLGQFEEAARHYEKALALHDNYADAHTDLAIALVKLGRPAEALRQCGIALRLKPDSYAAQYGVGNALFGLGRFEEAVRAYQASLRLDPEEAETHYNLGNTFSRLDRFGEAVAEYEAAVRIEPDYTEAMNNEGLALLRLGRPAEAVARYRAALRLKPGSYETDYNLGNALGAMGRPADAVPWFEAAIRLKPDFVGGRDRLGGTLINLGRFDDAAAQYNEALRISPADATARQGLGMALQASGRTVEAIGQYDAAVRLDPADPILRYVLGNALFQCGRTAEALEQYRAALRLRPNWAEAHGNLGSALQSEGRTDEAIAEYETALRLEPGLAGVRDNLERARALRRASGSP